MNLLFIQGGSRWKFDEEGNVYTDSNFNQSVWERYSELCSHFTVVLRREERIYSVTEAEKKFNKFNKEQMTAVAVPDIYHPVKNVFSFALRSKVKKEIERQVKAADKIIIRSLGNIYTNTALKLARKLNKPYLVEVTGFTWEGYWYHSWCGKLVAGFKERQYRHLMHDVPYAVYVTKEALQKRYPCKGKMLGCSDVELPKVESAVLDERIRKIARQNKIVIGTAAFLDVAWKGQEYVIRALALLKKEGLMQFEYQMIGAGTGDYLIDLARKLGVSNQVKIIGSLPHEQVFSWLDTIDIYVQSSFQEGLCRALVEAMSRACPIVCTNVGGNYELASSDDLFRKADYHQLARILERLADPKQQVAEATYCFEKAKEFGRDVLNEQRTNFYNDFMMR